MPLHVSCRLRLRLRLNLIWDLYGYVELCASCLSLVWESHATYFAALARGYAVMVARRFVATHFARNERFRRCVATVRVGRCEAILFCCDVCGRGREEREEQLVVRHANRLISVYACDMCII